MDVVLDEVDKEVTKVKKLVMEVNEDLVLVFIHCDGRRGYRKMSQMAGYQRGPHLLHQKAQGDKEKFNQLAKKIKEDLDVEWSTIWNRERILVNCVTLNSKDTND